MPRLWITEYTGLSLDGTGNVIPLPCEPGRTQVVDFGAACLSVPFHPETRVVRIISTADVWIEFGEDPRATMKSQFIPARAEAFRRVRPGDRVSITHGDD